MRYAPACEAAPEETLGAFTKAPNPPFDDGGGGPCEMKNMIKRTVTHTYGLYVSF
jgi:hypothetical protein